MEKKEIYEHIDYTCLKATATKKDIFNLCFEAIKNNCASVCIPSSYVKFVDEMFGEYGLNICTVVGFPLGNSSIETKVAETKQAIKDCADEIDMVINISEFKNGNYEYISREIETIKETIDAIDDNVLLKVIIETCYLTDEEIAIATKIVAMSSANYVKTSTGFGTRGASFHDIEIMKENIPNGFTKIKASGGIRTLEEMEKYIEMGCDRIGASCLP